MAFDANNIKGIMMKILKGKYAPISVQYSKELRDLVNSCLQREPKYEEEYIK